MKHARLVAALGLMGQVADRPDPMDPIGVGELAAAAGLPVSTASRLAAELSDLGMLERAGGYGSYRIGRRALALSGAAAAPFAGPIRFALTLAAQQTGETVCLLAPSGAGVRVIDSIASVWTMHVPADIGSLVGNRDSASYRAMTEHPDEGGVAQEPGCFESVSAATCEVAAAFLAPDGVLAGIVAVRFPVSRSIQSAPRARRAVAEARRNLEAALEAIEAAGRTPVPQLQPPADRLAPVAAGIGLLEYIVWSGPRGVAAIGEGMGLRADRVKRLVGACREAGYLAPGIATKDVAPGWVLQLWCRSVREPILRSEGRSLVTAAALENKASAYLTVLSGMRSFTLLEQLHEDADGLRMGSWLGRPHPLIGSDGGPTLVMDLEPQQIRQLFPSRHDAAEVAGFLRKVERVVADGVLVLESIDAEGLVSLSAPVRDASGMVVAAACLVTTAERIGTDAGALKAGAIVLASEVSELLGFERSQA